MRCQYINSKGTRCRKKATGVFRGLKTCKDCYKLLVGFSEERRNEVLKRKKK
ncbi:MAG: hypothetical protein M0R17_05755 [Candidatus Omnitrophica bacterium]|jgi:hypothetical protein|nr:hypothetical protein [Candidatus Omnitrophota bacterium]